MERWCKRLALGALTLIASETPTHLSQHETPRATDLFRAQRMADEAERRLRPPRSPAHGWEHGGGGWGTPAPAAEPTAPNVIINLRSPQRRRPQP